MCVCGWGAGMHVCVCVAGECAGECACMCGGEGGGSGSYTLRIEITSKTEGLLHSTYSEGGSPE